MSRIFGIGALTSGLFGGLTAQAAERNERPNVLLILADDLGVECLGCYGGESYKTPNLDRLAETGVRFDHCYVNTICAPTRLALMTGRYNFRNYEGFGVLPKNEYTFGDMMQDAGYVTTLTEKWQFDALRDGRTPHEAGFTEYYEKPTNKYNYHEPRIRDNVWTAVVHEGKYGPDLCADYLMNFMEKHQQEPFFAYYAMVLPHFPHQTTPDCPEWEMGDRFKNDTKRFFPAMVEYMDKTIGHVLDRLDELGLRENTLIIFLGDNGTDEHVVSRFRGKDYPGGKTWLTDAGTHVPLIVNWKGTIQGGRVLDDLVDPTDFLATIADATGAVPRKPLDGALDGVSFLPQLLGKSRTPRESVLIEYINEDRCWPADHPTCPGQEGRYVRDQRWKLYEKGTSKRGFAFYKGGELYDMQNDPEEAHPIVKTDDSAETAAIRAKFQKVFNEHPMKSVNP
ncbi:MAG: sulfatase-like hydrolase/transferase [Kiritimatiellales bacterium]